MSRTILVTRARGDEDEITSALHELGHHVIHEPLTEIILDHTLRAELHRKLLNDPSAILLSSKHAAQSLATLSEIRDVMLICVGEATAYTAQSLGFSRISVAGGTIEHLIEYLRDAYDEEARFLYISGADISSDLPAILQSFGMQCERIITYQALAAEYISDTLLEQMRRGYIDAVTFFSPRNVSIFHELLKKENSLSLLESIDSFVISSEIATKIQEYKWRRIFIAQKPTLASLIESVDNAYKL